MICEKVVIRSNGAGVFFGKLIKKEETEVTLENARKLYYWDGAGAVEGLAQNGTSKPKNCKFTVVVKEICIMNVLQIIPCTKEAIKSIESVPEWKA